MPSLASKALQWMSRRPRNSMLVVSPVMFLLFLFIALVVAPKLDMPLANVGLTFLVLAGGLGAVYATMRLCNHFDVKTKAAAKPGEAVLFAAMEWLVAATGLLVFFVMMAFVKVLGTPIPGFSVIHPLHALVVVVAPLGAALHQARKERRRSV